MEPLTRPQIDAMIAERLAASSEFRTQLLNNPKSAIEELTGREIPDFVTISVHVESLTDLHLVVRPSHTELSDEDLALVAAGRGWSFKNDPNNCDGACTLYP